MFDWLLNLLSVILYFLSILLLFPAWAMNATGLWFLGFVVAGVELALIVLAAVLPIGLSSRAGRIVVAVAALTALNIVCNLIWPMRI